jgi:hypothetical protein
MAEDGGEARGLRRWWGVLVALGAALALFMAARPGDLMLLNRGDRPTRVWAALAGRTPLERYLPSLVSAEPDQRWIAGLWLVAMAMLLGLDRVARRRARLDSAFRGLGLALALVAAVGVGVDAWVRPREWPDPDGRGKETVSSTDAAASGSARAGPRTARPG